MIIQFDLDRVIESIKDNIGDYKGDLTNGAKLALEAAIMDYSLHEGDGYGSEEWEQAKAIVEDKLEL